jgi:hypothetical protein
VDGIILFAKARAAIVVFGNSHGGRVAEGGELIREIVNVNRAVGAEVVVKNEENVAHADWRL